MLSTGYASLRYPDIDDVDINQSTLDLLSDIEYRNNANAARLAELKRSRGAWLQFNGSINAASSSTVLSTYTSELLDSDNYANLAVNNDRIILPKGVFLVTASTLMTCSFDMTTTQMEILFGGSVYASVSNGPYQGNALPQSLVTLYRCTTSSTALQVQVTQFNGSAAVGHLVFTDLQVARIGIL